MTDATPAPDGAPLPIDSDVDVEEGLGRTPRPVHFRPASLALVFVGGTVGTAAREGLILLWPPIAGVPVAVFAANITGAFLLGILLDALARLGAEGRRQRFRLLFGTGVLGGFTTYSALATDTAELLGSGSVGAGLAYSVATLVIGAVATWAGIALAAAWHRPRRESR